MAETWKELRVFISSAFKDMQAERDHLVRFVFPRLREELLKRRMHLVNVDLRWESPATRTHSTSAWMKSSAAIHVSFACSVGDTAGSPHPKP
jgi:hypothetical protein